MDLNKVFLIGRLTRECEITHLQNGTAVCKFAIAVNRRKKANESNESADFFDVQLFGKVAEALKMYLTKGKQVAIDGRLQQDRWQKNGSWNYKISVIADNVQLIGGQQQPTQQTQPAPQGDFQEDIPF